MTSYFQSYFIVLRKLRSNYCICIEIPRKLLHSGSCIKRLNWRKRGTVRTEFHGCQIGDRGLTFRRIPYLSVALNKIHIVNDRKKTLEEICRKKIF